MNSNLNIIVPLCSAATLFFSILLFGKLRLSALVRYYALSSLLLAALAWGIERHNSGVWFFIAVTIAVKSLFIPWLIMATARRSSALLRLQSFVRPSSSYFMAGAMVLLTFFVMKHAPITQLLTARAPMFVAITLVLLGLLFMIVRRDLYGQIIGFLVMENGVALFGLVTIGSLPTLLEFGLFFLVTVLVLILATLSSQVQELNGSSDTEQLCELVD